MTQHEKDRAKLQHDKRQFDSMSTFNILRCLAWRERVFLLTLTNVATLTIWLVKG